MIYRIIVVSLLLGSFSFADIIGPAFRVEATNAMGTGVLEIGQEAGTFDDEGNFTWALSVPMPIMNTQGDEIAQLDSGSIEIIKDPVVALNFVVSSPAMSTVFNITSPLLTFPEIDADARASAAISVTDTGGNGSSLTGLFGGKSYQANYNGATEFVTLVDDLSFSTPFDSQTSSEEFPIGNATTPIGLVSDMSTIFNFELGSLDSASGTSVFVTNPVPEPAAGILAILALTFVIWKRRNL